MYVCICMHAGMDCSIQRRKVLPEPLGPTGGRSVCMRMYVCMHACMYCMCMNCSVHTRRMRRPQRMHASMHAPAGSRSVCMYTYACMYASLHICMYVCIITHTPPTRRPQRNFGGRVAGSSRGSRKDTLPANVKSKSSVTFSVKLFLWTGVDRSSWPCAWKLSSASLSASQAAFAPSCSADQSMEMAGPGTGAGLSTRVAVSAKTTQSGESQGITSG